MPAASPFEIPCEFECDNAEITVVAVALAAEEVLLLLLLLLLPLLVGGQVAPEGHGPDGHGPPVLGILK